MKLNSLAAISGALSLSAVPFGNTASAATSLDPNDRHGVLTDTHTLLIAPPAPVVPDAVSSKINISSIPANPSAGKIEFSWVVSSVAISLPDEVKKLNPSLQDVVRGHQAAMRKLIRGELKDPQMISGLANNIGAMRANFTNDDGRKVLDQAMADACGNLEKLFQDKAATQQQFQTVATRIAYLVAFGADTREGKNKTFVQITQAHPQILAGAEVERLYDMAQHAAYVHNRNELTAPIESQKNNPQPQFQPLTDAIVRLVKDADKFDDTKAVTKILRWIDWGNADEKLAHELQQQLLLCKDRAMHKAAEAILDRGKMQANNFKDLRDVLLGLGNANPAEAVAEKTPKAIQLDVAPASFNVRRR